MARELNELLALSQSPLWSERAAAARELVNFDDDRAAVAVRELLRDTDDTAVAEAALGALIDDEKQQSADVIFETIATGADELVDHLLYFLARRESHLRAVGLDSRARSGLSSSDTAVREGARETMEYLGWR